MQDQWVKTLVTGSPIRAVGVQATGLVQEINRRHGYNEEESKLMGEAVLGAILIASYCKQGEHVNLSVQGSGIFRQAFVDASSDGFVRGYGSRREMPENSDRSKGPWGEGILSVLRAKPIPERQPYTGAVPLLTGHLAKDLTFYWMQSEQIPSAVGINVRMKRGKVDLAYGFLVQALSGSTDSDIATVEQSLVKLPEFMNHLEADSGAIQVLSQIFSERAFSVLEEAPLAHKCSCSIDRVHGALGLVGRKELETMVSEGQPAIVRCDFCATEYAVTSDEIKKRYLGKS